MVIRITRNPAILIIEKFLFPLTTGFDDHNLRGAA